MCLDISIVWRISKFSLAFKNMTSFEEILNVLEIRIVKQLDDKFGIAITRDLYIRYDFFKVEFGLRSNFDPELNDADFVLNRIPPDELGVKAAINVVRKKVNIFAISGKMPINENIDSDYLNERKLLRNE